MNESLSPGERAARIAELQRQIAELRARLPKHSPPTAMMVALDELEDELERLTSQESGERRHLGGERIC